MMPISQSQLQALTALIHQLRKDWDLPGIRAALTKAATLGSAADVAVAACRCAADLEMRSPGLIPQPGVHWQGTTVAKRPVPVMCSEHHDHKAGDCRVCASLSVPRPETCVVPKAPRPVVWAKPADEPADLQRVRDLIDADNEATL